MDKVSRAGDRVNWIGRVVYCLDSISRVWAVFSWISAVSIAPTTVVISIAVPVSISQIVMPAIIPVIISMVSTIAILAMVVSITWIKPLCFCNCYLIFVIYLRIFVLCAQNWRIGSIESGRYTFARIPIVLAVRCCCQGIDCHDCDRAEHLVWQRWFATPVPAWSMAFGQRILRRCSKWVQITVLLVTRFLLYPCLSLSCKRAVLWQLNTVLPRIGQLLWIVSLEADHAHTLAQGSRGASSDNVPVDLWKDTILSCRREYRRSFDQLVPDELDWISVLNGIRFGRCPRLYHISCCRAPAAVSHVLPKGSIVLKGFREAARTSYAVRVEAFEK